MKKSGRMNRPTISISISAMTAQVILERMIAAKSRCLERNTTMTAARHSSRPAPKRMPWSFQAVRRLETLE